MYNDLKNLDLDALPADVRAVVLAAREEVSWVLEQNADLTAQTADLKCSTAALTERNAALATLNAELEALNARLEHFVKELNQVIYGTRSEKLTEDERQLAFEDIEVAQSEAEEQSDTIEMTKPRKKRKQSDETLA